MDWGVYQQEIGVALAESADRGESAMRGAVVDDPENAPSLTVGHLLHDLVDEAVEGGDARLGFTTAEQLGTMDIAGGEVGPSADAFELGPNHSTTTMEVSCPNKNRTRS